MRWWLAGALASGVGLLAAARYLDGPLWLDAFVGSGGCFGLAVGLAMGAIVKRVAPRVWLGLTSLALAVGAALTRAALVAQVLEAQGPIQVDFWQVLLASATVAWGGLALLWGVCAVADATGGDSAFASKVKRYSYLAGAAAAVALALYSVAPLGLVFGLRMTPWTLLGLFALAATAYGVGSVYRWLAAR